LANVRNRIKVSTDPAGLLDDLREIGRVCASESPAPELDYIAQIRPIRPGERTAKLDARLDELLGADDPPDVGLTLPTSLAEPTTVSLPRWTSDLADEDAYNRRVVGPGSGYVLLDKCGLRTRQHNRGSGIEACDLLGPDNELIHVKRADRSSALSHLFAQGEVSFDALRNEPDARERLVAQARSRRLDHPIDIGFKPQTVVYAIALASGKPLTADTLLSFAQVALYRAVRRLRRDGVDVAVVAIPT
jgi:hypothetical protein